MSGYKHDNLSIRGVVMYKTLIKLDRNELVMRLIEEDQSSRCLLWLLTLMVIALIIVMFLL